MVECDKDLESPTRFTNMEALCDFNEIILVELWYGSWYPMQ
jgi:hypothetical protein